MAGSASLIEALHALLAPSGASGRGRKKSPALDILVAQSCLEGERAAVELAGPAFEAVDDDKLAEALRSGDWRVLVLPTLEGRRGGSWLRALEGDPVPLLVCTGEVSEQARASLQAAGVALLGPHARLVVDHEAHGLAVGVDAAELRGLRRVCGPTRLALAPTPGWLAKWLLDEALADQPGLGTVHAGVLGRAWLDLCEQPRAHEDLWVPVGVPALELEADASRDPATAAAWRQASAAHALERLTGPVFPSPRVLVALHRSMLGDSRDSSDAASPAQRAMWSQARRAIARESAAESITEPGEGLDLRTPASALLAQGPLARRARALALLAGPVPAAPRIDEELQARAHEVLRASPEQLSEHEAKVVLRGYGFEITRQAVANSASGAASFADRIGYPVVLKALSPSLRRRFELGAVKLDLPNAASVRRAYGEVVANVEREAPTTRLDGVVVAEMIAPGFEIRCGLRRIEEAPHADGPSWVIFAQATGPGATPEPVACAAPLRPEDALCAAELVLSRLPTHARRRAADPQAETLAVALLRLQQMVDALADRLVSVDLEPLRLLASDEESGESRDAVVLDASIRQLPHLEGL